MPTCRLPDSFNEMYVRVEPNRDCVYGSCRRPMHRKLLQEAATASTFVMMIVVFDRFLLRQKQRQSQRQREEEKHRKGKKSDLQLRQRQIGRRGPANGSICPPCMPVSSHNTKYNSHYTKYNAQYTQYNTKEAHVKQNWS